ncbi:3-oxo-5-alpha-steroid 4-dehydrogenase 2 [Merluccius polli]|uniref:3-oxo-5-alpha-steroid 4-dehydrogenase 2 n=1 Tax=Merluccius polli TaxID=89951 RepID=A0AA47N654_MERPO|nr:3-oxo-5-alpha-steroid 4-dehydrogenase 2 [Merluccius polli]
MECKETVVQVLSWAQLLGGPACCWALLCAGRRTEYGRYADPRDRCVANTRLVWMVQEIPALLVPLVLLLSTETRSGAGRSLLLGTFCLHYFYRSLIYPWRTRGRPFPLHIAVKSFIFCSLNGLLQGHYLLHCTAAHCSTAQLAVGLSLFSAGLIINIHSDTLLGNLRRPGELVYKIPRGGMFELVGAATRWRPGPCLAPPSAASPPATSAHEPYNTTGNATYTCTTTGNTTYTCTATGNATYTCTATGNTTYTCTATGNTTYTCTATGNTTYTCTTTGNATYTCTTTGNTTYTCTATGNTTYTCTTTGNTTYTCTTAGNTTYTCTTTGNTTYTCTTAGNTTYTCTTAGNTTYTCTATGNTTYTCTTTGNTTYTCTTTGNTTYTCTTTGNTTYTCTTTGNTTYTCTATGNITYTCTTTGNTTYTCTQGRHKGGGVRTIPRCQI